MKHPAAWCAAAAVVVLFACSSGNGNGFPFSGPSCPASAIPQGCWSCIQGNGNCNGGCVTSECSDFFTCFCACNAGDVNCEQGCASKATSACQQCISQVDSQSCQQTCAGQCNSSSMGGGSGFGSSSSGGGSPISCESSDGSVCITFDGPSTTTCPSGSTLVSSCPSSDELGACGITATGSTGSSATVTEHYYCAGAIASAGGTASTYQQACTSANGLWTAGSVTQCGDGGPTGSSSGGGSGSSSGTGSSSGAGSSSGGPTDGGGPICNSVPCGDAGQSMQYCEIDQGGACAQAWYQVGAQVFDCTSCSASGCMAAEQAAAMACP